MTGSMPRQWKKLDTDKLCALLVAAVLLVSSLMMLLQTVLYKTETYSGYDNGILENLEVTDSGSLRVIDPDANWIFPELGIWLDSVEVDIREFSPVSPSEDLTVRIYYDCGRGLNVDDSLIKRFSRKDREDYDRVFSIGKHRKIGSFKLQFGMQVGSEVIVDSIRFNPRERGWMLTAVLTILAGTLLGILFGRRFSGRARLAFVVLYSVSTLFVCWLMIKFCRIQIILLLAGIYVLALAAEAAAVRYFAVQENASAQHVQADRRLTLCLLLFFFALYLIWSLSVPYMDGPDEPMRYQVVEFVRNHGTLPRGDDPEVMNPAWGISYAFNPILPYIIGGLLGRIAALFTKSAAVYYFLAKLVSILSGVLLVYWCDRIGEELFPGRGGRVWLPVLAGAWPQIAYMAVYVNNDSFALMTAAMIMYFWILGIRNRWGSRECLGLGTGIGLCALSYYNCYGYILLSIPLFYYSLYRMKQDRAFVLRATGIVSGTALVIGGWWFVRNAILYNGDFLARGAMRTCAEANALPEFKPSFKWTWLGSGRSLMDMFLESDYIEQVTKSFVGYFGVMTVELPMVFYVIFYMLLYSGAAVLLWQICRNRKGRFYILFDREEKQSETDRKVYILILALAAIIPIGLAIYYAYAEDYQPQGRYFLPASLPLMLFCVSGWDRAMQLRNDTVKGRQISIYSAAVLCLVAAGALLSAFWGIEYGYYH